MRHFRTPAAALTTAVLLLGGFSTAPAPSAVAAPALRVHRVAGASRVATAVEVARAAWSEGAEAVVLARADDYADALSGGPLAATLDAPVLLTGADRLDPLVSAEVERLSATRVVMLGGAKALSNAVEAGLRALGLDTVERLSGADRFATAAAIAAAASANEAPTRIYLAEGLHADPRRGWPDAVAASAAAARDGGVVLLTAGERLPRVTRDAITATGADEIVIAGGAASVPSVVEAELRELHANVRRVAGADRFATAASLAAPAAEVWIASGANWPDALVAGPAAARRRAAVLLSDRDGLPAATRGWLDAHTPAVATLVGGAGTLSESVRFRLQPPPADGVYDDGDIDYGALLRWSDPATWGGAPPREGQLVTIPHGREILMDVSPPELAGLQVDGMLRVADRPLTLRTGWIMVHGGRFEAGTVDQPLRNRVEITLLPKPGEDVHGMGPGAFGAMAGGVIDLHALAPSPTWTRLADTASAGSSVIVLQRPVDWRPGDRIVVASTSTNPDEAEERIVASVDGATVRLDRPLGFTHWGRTHEIAGRAVPMHAEVGLLSRRLVVQSPESAAASGVGGHVMAHRGTTMRVSGVEFVRLGQTGVLARYPVHFHMMGDTGKGSYVRDSAVRDANHRCVTIHASNHTAVTGNVAFRSRGHCYFLEDGNETGNVISGNLGLGTVAPPADRRLLKTDATPATFWIQHPTNEVSGNAAAGSHGFGIWYDLPERPTGFSADSPLRPREAPMGVFADNVVHSTRRGEVFKSGTGLFVEDYRPPGLAPFRGLLSYGNGAFGAWVDNDPDIEVRDAVFAGNNIGFLGRSATLRDSLVVGATPNAAGQPWVMQGVGFYHDRALIDGVTFANFNPEGNREHFALGSIVESHNAAAGVRGARFVNVAPESRLLASPWWSDAPTWTTVLEDLDGSVTGAPATIVSDHALVRRPECAARPEWDAFVCPLGAEYVTVRFADLGDGDKLGPVTVTRGDGAAGPVHADPDWSERPLVDFTARFGDHYRVAFSRPTPAFTELVLSSDGKTAGDVTVSVPWPHAAAFVYHGWGEWAQPLGAGGSPSDTTFTLSGGVLTLRPRADDRTTWARWVLCAAPGCGEGIGSKR